MVAVGAFSSFTKSDTTSLGFPFKLGAIYDINTDSSFHTCEGMTQPTYSATTPSATFTAGTILGYTIYDLTLDISDVTQSNSALVGNDIKENIQTTAVEDFEEVCWINDLGNDITYKESGVTSLEYYYPVQQ